MMKNEKGGAGEANISAAKEVLERARAGTAERGEITDMITTLQELQNDPVAPVDTPEIRATLAGLIEVRGD